MKDNMPRVAVLLAAFNGKKWIEQQLSSICSQAGVQVTVFVSVDLSTDGTDTFFAELVRTDTSIVLLPYGKRFGGASANFFRLIRDVDFSGYDAVAFADQDDVWFPDKLARAWKKIQTDGFDAYSSNVVALWSDGKEKLIDKAGQQKELDYFFEAAGPGCTYVLSQPAMLGFKNFLDASGELLKDVEFHDWLAYAYCRAQEMRWFIDKHPSMYYRQHASNQIGVNHGWAAGWARWKTLRSKAFRKQVNLIASLVHPEAAKKISNNLFLIKNFRQLRRRPRDTVLLFIFIIVGIY